LKKLNTKLKPNSQGIIEQCHPMLRVSQRAPLQLA